MHILVINCGSSSLKAAILDTETGARPVTAHVERIGEVGAAVTLKTPSPNVGTQGALDISDHHTALEMLLPRMLALAPGVVLDGVGHRVVHGGTRFSSAALIDDDVVAAVDALSALAPLHNPVNLEGIKAARALLPQLPQVAVFDTAFHRTMPRRARSYAIPRDLAEKHSVERFGFHGTSHAWIASRAAAAVNEDPRQLRIITAHLGNGASVCAVEYGRSVETSMGMTPLEGLVMGTRSGDVDPGAVLALARAEGMDVAAIDRMLNRESGLLGLSGVSNDMRDLETLAGEGHAGAQLAVHVFCHRVRKYIGAYAAVMGGVDVIAVSAGIGENSPMVRHRLFQRLSFLGAHLDETRNRLAEVSLDAPVAMVSAPHSRVGLAVVATDEQRSIAHQTAQLVRGSARIAGSRLSSNAAAAARTIPVAISARHVHLTTESVEALFGQGHRLTERKPLSQPGQFLCNERVTVVGPKRRLEGVAIIGPERGKNQIEVSRTDEFHLGVDAPVRDSGDVSNSPGITLVGPAGELTLVEGVICARRHIHMRVADAAAFGVEDRDVVEVIIDSEGRDLVFGDVLVRVSDRYALEMHVDTDEANAAELSTGDDAVLGTTGGIARLRRRQPGI